MVSDRGGWHRLYPLGVVGAWAICHSRCMICPLFTEGASQSNLGQIILACI